MSPLLWAFLSEHHLLDAVVISGMGGVVSYILHQRIKPCNAHRLKTFLQHLIVSMFTGLLIGLLCVDFNATTSQTLFFAGVAGTSGSEIILLLQKRLSLWLGQRKA